MFGGKREGEGETLKKHYEININHHGYVFQFHTVVSQVWDKWSSSLTGKIMDCVHDSNIRDSECNYNKLSEVKDGKCIMMEFLGEI